MTLQDPCNTEFPLLSENMYPIAITNLMGKSQIFTMTIDNIAPKTVSKEDTAVQMLSSLAEYYLPSTNSNYSIYNVYLCSESLIHDPDGQ